jgi:hypothetical protein
LKYPIFAGINTQVCPFCVLPMFLDYFRLPVQSAYYQGKRTAPCLVEGTRITSPINYDDISLENLYTTEVGRKGFLLDFVS